MKKFTILFLVRDTEVLLARKKTGLGIGRYNGVGGKVEANESVEQAMIRECQEEIRVRPTQFKPVAEIVFREFNEGKPYEVHAHAYLAKSWEGIPVETEEMATPTWFGIKDLPLNEMWADIPHWLPRVLSGEQLRCEFNLDRNDRIISKGVERVSSLDF